MRHLLITIILGSAVWFIPIILDWRKRRVNEMLFLILALLFHFCLYFFIYPTGVWRYHIHVIPLIYLFVVYGLQKTMEMLGEYRQSPHKHRGFPLAGWFFTADWMNDTLPSDSVIAMDMIGEVGYYTNLDVFDLGGLIDPDIWPCLADKKNLEGLMDTFIKKRVTHFLACDGHILWNFLPSRANNFKLIKEMPASKGQAKMFRCYEIDYSVILPVQVTNSSKSGSQRMPAIELAQR